jgi:MYXO-CTERM domain-containing protein
MIVDINRPSLRGLVPPAPYDSTDPLRDLELKRQWAAQYRDVALQFANQVVSALQARGFTVQILGETGSPGAGYVGLPQYAAILRQGGKAMDATIGNPVRFNSPADEAQELASLFSIYATDAQASTGFNTSVLAPVTSPPPPPPSIRNHPNLLCAGRALLRPQREHHRAQRLPGRHAVDDRRLGPAESPGLDCSPERRPRPGRNHYGNTDSQGQFQMRGTFTEDTVGQWSETVKVGGETVGSLQFTVLPPPVSGTPPASSQPNSPSSPGPFQTTVVQAGSPGPVVDKQGVEPATPAKPWYQTIPPWGWAAIGLGALLLMRDRR